MSDFFGVLIDHREIVAIATCYSGRGYDARLNGCKVYLRGGAEIHINHETKDAVFKKWNELMGNFVPE